MARQKERLPIVNSLRASNEQGDVIYGKGAKSPPVNIADRDFFIQLRDNPNAGLHISKPIFGRHTQKWVWVFARRINKSNGSFGGVVFTPILVDDLDKLLAKITLDIGGVATLRDNEMGLIARHVFQGKNPAPPGDKKIAKPFSDALKVNPVEGTYISDATSIDSIRRTQSYRRSAKYGYYVNVGISSDAALESWRKQAWMVVGVVASFILASLVFSWQIMRAWVRQDENMAAIAAGQNELNESAARFRRTLEHAPIGMATNKLDGHFIFVNQAFCTMLGYEKEDLEKLSFQDVTHPDDKSLSNDDRHKLLDGIIDSYQLEKRYIHKDGHVIWVQLTSSIEKDIQGEPFFIAQVEDISERKKAESDYKRYKSVLETTHDGYWMVDSEGLILEVNQAYADISGYSVDELQGMRISQLEVNDQTEEQVKIHIAKIINQGYELFETRHRHKDGHLIDIEVSTSYIPDLQQFVAFCRDITDRKSAEDQIEHLAFYDPLTHLPNRRLFLDRLQQALVSSLRSEGIGALLFIDLDNFKTLNDTLGHDIGDLLLQKVAERLTTCLREGDSVSRFGGDEFVVILEDISKDEFVAAKQVELISQKILSTLNRSYQLDSHTYHNTPSIGAVLFGTKKQGIEELLKQADIAMYQAKSAGRNTFRFFDEDMQKAINIRVELEKSLRQAIDRKQFQLYYQVQVNDLHHPIGAEVLIRGKHPERGMVSPAQFIPLAEETGLIVQIGHWVLDTACKQLKAWQDDEYTKHLKLSVNVSAKQFHEKTFAPQVQAIVQRYNINPGLLKLEPTESILQEDIEETVAVMNALRAIGIHFALDDFGTGFSSLQYLKLLPLDQLKIDQSFVRDLATDYNDIAIVRTIIAMAQSLGLDIIAEGVETAVQEQLLKFNGCNQYQGYLFGRPLPVEEFEASLQKK